tara:strand:+ start:2565 stop:3248 length:684 start_codon:yes stop_codon:yes gene_type:complete
MSESYDSFADIGEPHRMAPEGIITEDNIEQLTQMATGGIEEEQNQMEAPIKDKVSRKKNRSEKQKATFEKARQKRLENIANKKSQRKEQKLDNQVLEETQENSSPGKNTDLINTLEEPSAPDKETLTKEEIHYDRGPGIDAETILKKTKPKKKKQKVVYIDPSSSEESSSEEEIIYVQRKKSKTAKNKRSEPKKRVVYQDDYGEEAEFQQRPRRNKPISFSDVFKYS